MDMARLMKKAGRDGEQRKPEGSARRIAELLGMKRGPEEIIRKCRSEIDGVDSAMVSLLGQRARLVKKIGGAKKELDVPVLDNGREEQVLAKVRERAGQEGLPPEETAGLYKTVIAFFRKLEGGD